MEKERDKRHLIFYDGTCGFCDLSVQFVMRHDKKKVFFFAPLQGKTAEKSLQTLPPELKNLDSVILIEDFQGRDEKIYSLGKAAFRVLWLLGGSFALPGLVSFPSLLIFITSAIGLSPGAATFFSGRSLVLFLIEETAAASSPEKGISKRQANSLATDK